ncbi:TIR domain protein [Roseovarius indicus]|uniref:TIR domain protein n=2 Tax=Roseovarius indicus TaxID=540747 RepID=A0A5P3AIF9_9RHOB|nr:TIR domain protein [Roseovarius indicus]SFD81323.1 TIR domain-containing protein [Roseovarius indicus]
MLVHARHNIWIDQWELNAGDSIIGKVQEAVGEADALLVVLSQASVASEWCQKELRTALVRELDEKRVLVIPCLIEDCDIPVFLKEKLYVDFRDNKGEAFELLDRSLSKVSNPAQSRIETKDFHTDWSVDWGDFDGEPVFEWLYVDHGPSIPYSVVTRIRLIVEDLDLLEFREMAKSGTHIRFGCDCLKKFLEEDKDGELRIKIEDENEIYETLPFVCPDGRNATIFWGVRRLGEDNGMSTLFSVDNLIRMSIQHSERVLREP